MAGLTQKDLDSIEHAFGRQRWLFSTVIFDKGHMQRLYYYRRDNLVQGYDKYLVIGTDDTIALANLFDLPMFTKDDKAFAAYIVPPNVVEHNANVKTEVERLRNEKPEVFALDVMSSSSKLRGTSKSSNPHDYYNISYTYDGEVDEKLAMTYAKTVFAHTVSRFWEQPFVITDTGRITTNAATMALARCVMYDVDDFELPIRARKGKKLTGGRGAALMNTSIDLSNVSGKAKDILSAATRFRDYARLWECAIRDDGFFAMQITKNDLLTRPDEVKDAFCRAADFIGMDSYINAYNHGVPVDDIVI